MPEDTASGSGVLGKFIEILLTDGVVLAALGAAFAFAFKLLGDYIAERNRQATNVRVLATYIEIAIENWNRQGITANPQSQTGFRISTFDTIAAKITRFHGLNSAGGELYTPFVPFSELDDLTIDKVRELVGFLDQPEIAAVIKFVEFEAMTHAVARDFRSELVRRTFTQERKLGLLERFNDALVRARCAAEHARGALAPFKDCPTSVWYTPWGPNRQRLRYLEENWRSFSRCQLGKSAGGTKPCQCFAQQTHEG